MAAKFITPKGVKREVNLDTNHKEPQEIEFMMAPSTLETVDRAFLAILTRTSTRIPPRGRPSRKYQSFGSLQNEHFKLKTIKTYEIRTGRSDFP